MKDSNSLWENISNNRPGGREKCLLILAGLFLFTCTLALILAPAVRVDSFNALSINQAGQVCLVFGIWLAGVIWAYRSLVRWLPGRDEFLFPTAALLSGWGLLLITRLQPEFGLRQALWFGGMTGLLALGARWAGLLDFLQARKTLWLTGCLMLVGFTLFLGVNPSGSGPNLWLGWGEIFFQPSEPLKLFLVVYLAGYLAGRPTSAGEGRPKVISLVLPTLWVTGLTAALLLIQRDLGTLTIILILYMVILYLATGRKRIVVLNVLFLVAAALGGRLLFPLVQARLESWLNPWLDPSGRSYQIVQSLMAVANGGLVGRGLGLGHPRLVPVAHSDFIFSALAEEFGLLGGIVALVLLGLLVQRGLLAARRAAAPFPAILAAGVSIWLGIQSIVIIGGNLRLLPLTGLTLPFLSYGGTSLWTSWFGLLILLHVSAHPGDAGRAGETLPPRRVATVFAALAAGLAALGLLCVWWGVWRAPVLLARTDNARRSLADLYVRRGSILDRNGVTLSHTDTSAGAGNYRRSYDYPDLAPVLGYIHPIYGQAGLEASLDDYLRGETGPHPREVWTQRLLTGYPPPGVDIYLTLDLTLQRAADQQLAGHPGALVLLDNRSGEVLVLASQPAYDPLTLSEDWPWLVHAPDIPLFDRPLLGRYPLPDVLKSESVSPLQMALAAAMSGGRNRPPVPGLVGWMASAGQNIQPFPRADDPLAEVARRDVKIPDLYRIGDDEWLMEAGEGQKKVTWLLANRKEPPLTLALVLEEANPALAQEIGRAVLKRAPAGY